MCLLGTLFFVTDSYALDKKSSRALSHYIMAVVHEDLGQYEKAVREYGYAIRYDPRNAFIHLRLASSFVKKNDVPAAIEELNRAAKIAPETVEPHAMLALLYSSQNKFDTATTEYELALENASKLEPQNVEIYRNLAAVYLQQKKFSEAEKTFKLILDLSPDDATSYFFLGNISEELGKREFAEKYLSRALELKPDFPEALNSLGYLYVEGEKNLEKAEEMITKALEFEPNNGAYIDSLGWLYFKKGKVKEALEKLERAATLLEDPAIFDHLGEAYLKVEDVENAKRYWQKSLKLDSGQEEVKKKLEALR